MSDLTAILPAAGLSSRFPNMRPKWMLTTPDGALMLRKAYDSLKLLAPKRVVIGILAEHDRMYSARHGIRMAMGDDVEIIVFETLTKGPADTTAQIVQRAKVNGPFLAKDSDGWFTLLTQEPGNAICVADLHDNPTVDNITAKSFVVSNEQGIVQSIVEKRVVSNQISVGGYAWDSAEEFLHYFRVVETKVEGCEMFMSHVITEAIVQGEVFFTVKVDNYQDVGTNAAWQRFRNSMCVYFLDIDGVVVKNRGEYWPPYWTDEDEPIEENVAHLLKLQAKGAQFIFYTSRPERLREKTEATLRRLKLKWHSIVMGVNHSSRILVNDYSNTNPYPSCSAVNQKRDTGSLPELIPLARECNLLGANHARN